MPRFALLAAAACGLAACDKIVEPDLETPTRSPHAAARTSVAAASPFAYVANSSSNTVSVIDTETNTVVATVPVGDQPTGVASTPDGAFVYVTNQGANQGGTVSVIETATNTVAATVPIGRFSTDIAITPDGAFAYLGSYPDQVEVISTATNTVVETIDVGSGSPVGVAITPDGAFVYVNQWSSPGRVSVIATATNTVVETIDVAGNWDLAVTPDGASVYLAATRVTVIEAATNTVAAYIDTGSGGAHDVAMSPDGRYAYVTINSFTGGVAVIATATRAVEDMISVPVNVRSLAITPDGAFIYVTHGPPSGGPGIVYVISTSSNEVVDTIEVGLWPSGVAITPTRQRNGQARVQICHKGKQIRVAEPAVNAHLRHGDTFPPCN